MDKFICTCTVKVVEGDLNERLGFGFDRHDGRCVIESENKNMFSGIVSLVNLFKNIVKSDLDEDAVDDLDYFLQKAKDGILTEIEIGDDYDYDDIYLNVSIDNLDKFFDKNSLKSDPYLGYINVDLDNEKDVIDYVLKNEFENSFDKNDVDNGFVQLEKIADGVWVVQVDHA